MKRDIFQRFAYSLRRVSRAVDSLIIATDSAKKERARFWVKAWARPAKLEKHK